MTAARRMRGGWTAALAGLLLAVQAALLAFSIGADAAPLPRDRFGNLLCTTDAAGDHGTPAEPGERHGGRLDCCSAGCPMAGGGLVPGSSSTPPARHPLPGLPIPFALHENDAGAGVPASPRSARAPPLPA